MPALRDVVSDLRTRAGDAFGLPEGEGLTIEEVRDEPWWAFNYYSGNLTSRVVVNVDVPTSGPDLVQLAAHEAYPGHHLEHVWKEQLLVRDRDLLEEIDLPGADRAGARQRRNRRDRRGSAPRRSGRAEVQALLQAHGAGYDAEAAHELGVALRDVAHAPASTRP